VKLADQLRTGSIERRVYKNPWGVSRTPAPLPLYSAKTPKYVAPCRDNSSTGSVFCWERDLPWDRRTTKRIIDGPRIARRSRGCSDRYFRRSGLLRQSLERVPASNAAGSIVLDRRRSWL